MRRTFIVSVIVLMAAVAIAQQTKVQKSTGTIINPATEETQSSIYSAILNSTVTVSCTNCSSGGTTSIVNYYSGATTSLTVYSGGAFTAIVSSGPTFSITSLPTGSNIIIDHSGNYLDLVKQNDLYNAGRHGILVYGLVDTGSGPDKYAQIRIHEDGSLIAHPVDSADTIINPSTNEGIYALRSALTASPLFMATYGTTTSLVYSGGAFTTTSTISGSVTVTNAVPLTVAAHGVTSQGTWTNTVYSGGSFTAMVYSGGAFTTASSIVGSVTVTNAVPLTVSEHKVSSAGTWTSTVYSGGAFTATVYSGGAFTTTSTISGSVTVTNAVPLTVAAHQVTSAGTWTSTVYSGGSFTATVYSGATITVTSKTLLTAGTTTSRYVGVASAEIVPTNAARRGLILVNASTNAWMSVAFGGSAVLYNGITLAPNGGAFSMDEYSMSSAAVHAISSVATSTIAIQEFQ